PAFWSEPRRLLAAAREEMGSADAAAASALEARSAELDRAAGADLARADEVLDAVPVPIPEEVPEAALVSRLPASFRRADAARQRVLLDLALAWPTAAMVPALLAI